MPTGGVPLVIVTWPHCGELLVGVAGVAGTVQVPEFTITFVQDCVLVQPFKVVVTQ